jgi:hypothetical protein
MRKKFNLYIFPDEKIEKHKGFLLHSFKTKKAAVKYLNEYWSLSRKRHIEIFKCGKDIKVIGGNFLKYKQNETHKTRSKRTPETSLQVNY